MSRLLITIDTDNDAFQENGWQQEAARVLTQLAAKLAYNRDRDTTGTLRDTGAADCGAWDYHAEEPEDEGDAVSSREAHATDGETSVAAYCGQTAGLTAASSRRYRVLAIETRTHATFVDACSERNAKQQAANLWDSHGDKCIFEVVYIEEAAP